MKADLDGYYRGKKVNKANPRFTHHDIFNEEKLDLVRPLDPMAMKTLKRRNNRTRRKSTMTRSQSSLSGGCVVSEHNPEIVIHVAPSPMAQRKHFDSNRVTLKAAGFSTSSSSKNKNLGMQGVMKPITRKPTKTAGNSTSKYSAAEHAPYACELNKIETSAE